MSCGLRLEPRRYCLAHFLVAALVCLIASAPSSVCSQDNPQQDDTAGVDAASGDATQETGQVDFVRDIKPILEAKCLRCHGPEDNDSGFRIDERSAVADYVSAGDADGSMLYDYVSTTDESYMMPPPGEGGPLPTEEVARFKAWIDQGADWPEDAKIEPPSEEVVQETEQEIEADAAASEEEKTVWQLLWDMCGLLHPVAVHFPIAMLIGGALFAVLGIRGESPMSDAAFYCLWIGTLGAIFAAASGWSFGIHESYLNWKRFEWDKTIDLHRWGGVLVAVLAFILAVFATISRRRDPYASGVLWKLGLVALAVLVGFVGHQGGKMQYPGLHEELLDKATRFSDKVMGQSEATRQEKEQQQQKEAREAEERKAAAADEDASAKKEGDGGANPDQS